MRNVFAKMFYEAAKRDPRLCLVVADISPAVSLEQFRKEYPQRFINTGVAEQIMIGICAGMAIRGFRPFAYTIATFALFRPYEFVRDDLCYQGLPVTVVGVGGGVSYSTLGGTHHAMEDVAIACAMPNMRVIAPCDPEETLDATRWCVSQNDGPAYLRLGKAGEPVITQNAEPFEFGKLRVLKKGRGVCILGYGPILKLAMDAASDTPFAVVAAHTLKPLDRRGIVGLLKRFSRIVVLEEMIAHGGLGETVRAIAWESHARCEIRCLALKDEFIHMHASREDLLSAHGLTAETIEGAIHARI